MVSSYESGILSMGAYKLVITLFSKTRTLNIAILLRKNFFRAKKVLNGLRAPDIVSWQSSPMKKSVFVDISSLMAVDHGGGIQRVQRSLVKSWVECPPKEFNIFPIYYDESEKQFRYVYQDQLGNLAKLGHRQTGGIKLSGGDIYLNLDLNYRFIIENEDFYRSLKLGNVNVYFMIYDLLPLSLPEAFPEGIHEFHSAWFEFAVRNSKLLCISKSVEVAVKEWGSIRGIPTQTASITLGSDISSLSSSSFVLEKRKNPRNPIRFLLVSTLEVRKRHELVLDAFEILWDEGYDVTLTFVGRTGWKVDDLLSRIKSHRYLGSKLIWLNDLGDVELQKTYIESTALINASVGEGFGLPLVEASLFGLPLILRDIPIFREIAGEKAWYFATDDAGELAISVKSWIAEYMTDRISPNTEINVISWKDTCNEILGIFKSDQVGEGVV